MDLGLMHTCLDGPKKSVLTKFYRMKLAFAIVMTIVVDSYSIPVFVNGPDKFGFHHGTHANFVDVFGEQKILWFLPVNSA